MFGELSSSGNNVIRHPYLFSGTQTSWQAYVSLLPSWPGAGPVNIVGSF